MIVRTFLDAEAEKLADKTLVPFTTRVEAVALLVRVEASAK